MLRDSSEDDSDLRPEPTTHEDDLDHAALVVANTVSHQEHVETSSRSSPRMDAVPTLPKISCFWSRVTTVCIYPGGVVNEARQIKSTIPPSEIQDP